MIKVINLSKSFSTQLLFDSVSFSINQKERIGLVGRNGHGKTTLLRIIIGEEQADSGEIAIPRNYRIGYVTQQLLFSEQTVLAEACREIERVVDSAAGVNATQVERWLHLLVQTDVT